jgi:hypothetical protein
MRLVDMGVPMAPMPAKPIFPIVVVMLVPYIKKFKN